MPGTHGCSASSLGEVFEKLHPEQGPSLGPLSRCLDSRSHLGDWPSGTSERRGLSFALLLFVPNSAGALWVYSEVYTEVLKCI